MAFTQITLGLTLTIPTNGTRNWGTTLKNTTWTKISSHDHTGSGNGAQLSSAAISNFSITSAKLAKNIALYQSATILLPVGTTQTVSWDDGNSQILNLSSATGDVTVTLSNPQTGGLYRLIIIQGATPRNVIWPASVKWPQAQAAILSTGVGDVDVVEMYFQGTNYLSDWQVDFA